MKKTDYIVLVLFVILYVFITFCGQCPFINAVRFSIICLSLIPALCYGVPMAAGFTIISDAFLLFTHFEKMGVFCFCLVQLYYISFFLEKNPSLWSFFFCLPLLLLPLTLLGVVYAF